MTSRSLDLAQVRQLLCRDIELAGGQSEWSRRTGVHRGQINKMLRGHRPIGRRIIQLLGLKKVKLPIERELLELLSRQVEKAGTQAEWARRNAANRTTLNQVMSGRKSVGPVILRALKIQQVVVYVLDGTARRRTRGRRAGRE
jgi:DNA-binding transcriptional regulator YdaS (Cro superfamily)